MSDTLRWTCPMSTRGAIAWLTSRSLRASGGPVPAPRRGPWLRPPGPLAVHRSHTEHRERRQQCLYAADHCEPPFSALDLLSKPVRKCPRLLLPSSCRTPFDASRKSDEYACRADERA